MKEWIGSLYGWRRKKTPREQRRLKESRRRKKNTKNLTEHLHLPTSISIYTFILSLSLPPSLPLCSFFLFLYSEFSCWFVFLSISFIRSHLIIFVSQCGLHWAFKLIFQRKRKRRKRKKSEWPQWEQQQQQQHT